MFNEVSPEDFYHPSHQVIFKAMLALQNENEPVDLHTLSDHLNAAKKLDRVGGLVFLSELADYEATAANVVHHARIVRDKSVKRSLIRVSSEITETCFEETVLALARSGLEDGVIHGNIFKFRIDGAELAVVTASPNRFGELFECRIGFRQ